MGDERSCEMCRGIGWIFDGRPDKSPTIYELLPCPFPDCAASGRHVEHLSLNLMGFRQAVQGPDGLVMAVGRAPGGPRAGD